MDLRALLALGALAFGVSAAGAPERPSQPDLVSVRRIWDRAPHCAFTDLVRYRDRWFCVFREGQAHVSPDGAIRVLTSGDGETWTSAALVRSSLGDLRDPKIDVAPGNRLVLSAAAALPVGAPAKHQSLVWFSGNGSDWGKPAPIGDPNFWLWRITWDDGTAYSVGYSTAGRELIRLYTSRDGTHFRTLVDNLYDQASPNETSLLFLDDNSSVIRHSSSVIRRASSAGGTCLCLLRRDAGNALLGKARPPYREWSWRDLGERLGGPRMIRLPDGRIVAAGRLYDGRVRTALCWLDPEAGRLAEFLALPSGGDTSYPGLVWHGEFLWVSYYSSHEGRTAVYLAKVRLPKFRAHGG